MKNIKRFFWGIIFLCPTLSCSDEGGTIENQHITDTNFTVFTEIFQEFLDARAANTFIDGNSGLTFTGEQPCGFVNQPSMHFDNQYYTLTATTCNYFLDPGPDGEESFSIINSALVPSGLTIYAVITFLNQGIPETGTYPIEYICDFYCLTTISVRIYFVDQQNNLVSYYVGYPTSIDVVNNNGKITASFDTDFYSYFYPFTDNVYGSGSISCCN
jgi:hypothetical protein